MDLPVVQVCCLVLVVDNFVSANGKIYANSRLYYITLLLLKCHYDAKQDK